MNTKKSHNIFKMLLFLIVVRSSLANILLFYFNIWQINNLVVVSLTQINLGQILANIVQMTTRFG